MQRKEKKYISRYELTNDNRSLEGENCGKIDNFILVSLTSSGVVVRSTGAYERLSGHLALFDP